MVLFSISFPQWWPLTSSQALQQRGMFWRTISRFPELFWIFPHPAAVTAAMCSSVSIWYYKTDSWHTHVDFGMWETFLTTRSWYEITHPSPADNSWNFKKCVRFHFVWNVVWGEYFHCWRLYLLCSSSNIVLSIHDDYSHLNYTESSCTVFWD